jgi:2-keto-4-pentenoate hydratase/2-oxohepta-3-ene-1,7-dioic acid hydratase in catechol pathway
MFGPVVRRLPVPVATRGGCRRIVSLSNAAAGNYVKFLGTDGAEHWGALSGAGAKRAKIIDSILTDPSQADGPEVEISKILPPLLVDPSPAVILMGLSYKSHAAEVGRDLPRFPVYAFKNPASVIGTEASISIPSVAREKPEVDFEAEMAIVIGRPVRDVSVEDALTAVLGVTGANDVSARRWQGKKGGGQWSRAKSFDTFCPLGPTILPIQSVASALAPGGAGLGVRSAVNSKGMQDGNTSDMLFSIAEIVSYLSQGTTLLPGTFILTGTPPGVGYVRKPPVYLKEGDVVEVELAGCGVLTNPVENGP